LDGEVANFFRAFSFFLLSASSLRLFLQDSFLAAKQKGPNKRLLQFSTEPVFAIRVSRLSISNIGVRTERVGLPVANLIASLMVVSRYDMKNAI
jgi:hypothetical protein